MVSMIIQFLGKFNMRKPGTATVRSLQMLPLLFLCACLVCAGLQPAAAEDETPRRFWVGGAGEWASGEHWSALSGGPGGAGAPSEDAFAVFDGGSGEGQVLVRGDVTVLDLLIEGDASPELALAMAEGSLTCRRDALLRGGRIDNRSRAFRLNVGRHLDTTGAALDRDIRLALTGTGWWRYSLEGPHKPSLHTLDAARPGHTTTLRPVGRAPHGVDIDTRNLVLGDHTSLLTMDVGDVVQEAPASVVIEIHQSEENHLDIVADGCRIAITAIQREAPRIRNARLQHKLDLSGMGRIYDLTGAPRAWERFKDDPARAFGGGPTWTLTGPTDLVHMTISIEKTGVLSTAGHALKAGRISISSNGGAAELHMGASTVTIAGAVTVGASGKFPGLLDVGTGTLRCERLFVRRGSILTGEPGAVIDVREEFSVAPDAKLQLDGVVITGRQPVIQE
jgi:hypothetical protein